MSTETPRNRPGGARVQRNRRRRRPDYRGPLLAAALFVLAVILAALVLVRLNSPAPASTPSPTPSQSQAVPSTPAPNPTPTSTPTQSEAGDQGEDVAPPDDIALVPPALPTESAPQAPEADAYDFSQCVPESEGAEEAWFSDAVFIGDSRTDGLRLYGGIEGADFIQHTGIMVFEVDDAAKKVIKSGGKSYTVMEALGLKQYGKVYVMLGVNELGYFNDKAFQVAYAAMVDRIREIQPGAVIYLQTLVRINPERAKANDIPYYVTNETIDRYNEYIAQIAEDKKVFLVDVNAGLIDETGVLPREGTGDGVHFSKAYCVKWHEYLLSHTVDPDLYWAAQTTEEGENG